MEMKTVKVETSLTETSLKMKRVFKASLSQLYQAWTEPEMLNKWFLPNKQLTTTTTVDLRVGGRYEIQMHPPEGEPFLVGGVYREIRPQEKLVFTWRWAHEPEDMETLVTIKFRAINEMETELILLHEQFVNIEERDNHRMGWEGVFTALTAVIE